MWLSDDEKTIKTKPVLIKPFTQADSFYHKQT